MEVIVMTTTPPTREQLRLIATRWGAAWADPIMGEVSAMMAEEELRSTRPDLADLDERGAANLLLANGELMKSLSAKQRFGVLTTLFGAFTLPDGWLAVARKSGFTDEQIAAAITARVRDINSRKKAVAEKLFIQTLLAVPEDESLRYQQILSSSQLREIRRVLLKHAKPEIQAVRDPRSMGWRHGLV
jgi:hypothetical protein